MNFLKNKFMLRTLFGAYILLLIVVMAANGALVGNVCRQMNSELKRVNDYYLRILKLNMDNIFSDAEALKKQITEENTFSDFTKYKSLNSNARFEAAGAVDELADKIDGKSMIRDAVIYYPESDTVITSTAFYDSESYFNIFCDSEMSYDEWLADFDKKMTHTFSAQAAITYPVRDNGGLKYYIRLLVDGKDLFTPIYFDRYASGGASVVILSKNGDTLLSGDGKPYDFKNAMFEKEYEIRTYRPIDKKVFVYFVNSERFDYRYVLVSDKDYYTDNLQRIFFVGLGVSVLCIVCIGVILLFVNKKNSRRLSSIMQEFDEDEAVYDGDEFSVIKQRIALTKKKNEVIEEKLEKQTRMLQNSVIVNYLLGYTDSKDIEEKFSDYRIIPKYDCWFAVAMSVFDFGILSDLQNSDTIFVINNVVEDLTHGEYVLRVDIDGMLVYLVNVADNSREHTARWVEITEKIRKLMQENFAISFYCAVSRVTAGLENLAGAYREAASGIDSARFYDVQSTVLYEEICKSGAAAADEAFVKAEREVITAIKLGDENKAKINIDKLFETGHEIAHVAKWQYEAMMYNILNSISQQESEENEETEIRSAFAQVSALSISGMKQLLLTVAHSVCEGMQNENKTNNEIYRRIKQYVEENYTNTALDVTRIGEQLGMAPFYLSRVFKNCSGEKLVGFINSLRIEHAKKLLCDPGIVKVNDVAANSGYENVRTFLKVFKEKEGMTPTQYRKMHLK